MFPTKVLSGDVVTENGQKSSSEPKRRKFMNWIKDILRKANRNAFEISKDGIADLEELELNLIDAGLDSMEIDEDIIHIYGDYTSFGSLAQALESIHADVKKAALERIATNPVEFSEEQLIDIEKLLDKIEDDDDVQAVFTNIA